VIAIPISEKKKASNKKWNDANMKERYERIQIVVQKGEKEAIQKHARQYDKSLNAFINRAIRETIERETGVGLRLETIPKSGETL